MWSLVVIAAVAAEAIWFAAPNVVRGDISSIQAHLDSHLSKVAADRTLGSASLALIRDGEIVFERGYGRAHLDGSVDAERTLFQVGSVSKAVTAVGAMKLVQEGKIGLDDPVIRHLKRWRFEGSDDRRDRVTLRQLLSHTAGIADPPEYVGTLPDERPQTLEEYLSGVRIASEPGTSFAYGNAATAIVQLLIEDVTGKQFDEYMRAEVLRPLGMTNSTFDLDQAMDNLAPAFDAGVQPQTPRRHAPAGAVALYTSGHDLGRFAQSLAGGNSLLTPETIGMMMQPMAATGGTWGLGLALFATNDAGGHVVGHDGGAQPAWGAMVRFNPATSNGMVAAISGGRGAANQMPHDWVYWETGKLTSEARRQAAYSRARPAAIALLAGAFLICLIAVVKHRARGRNT